MDDNALKPSVPSLSGDTNLMPGKRPQSPIESFLGVFRGGNKGNDPAASQEPNPQPATQQPFSGEAPGISVSLNGMGGQPSSMDGADVVKGPNPPVASEGTVPEPQMPSPGSAYDGINSLPVPERSSIITPDSSGLPPETPDSAGAQNRAALEQAKNDIENVAQAAKVALENINAALGAQVPDADTRSSSKGPVGSDFST